MKIIVNKYEKKDINEMKNIWNEVVRDGNCISAN